MKLSILIPTIPERTGKLSRLLEILRPQLEARKDVELLILSDNRKRSVGEKRNALVEMALGAFIAFVDDDDRVASDYVQAIAGSLTDAVDVLVFDVWVSGYFGRLGIPDRVCRYDLSYTPSNGDDRYQRQPNHLMCWRKEMARLVPFPNTSKGEDDAWAALMVKAFPGARQRRIDRVLYWYDYDDSDTVQRS